MMKHTFNFLISHGIYLLLIPVLLSITIHNFPMNQTTFILTSLLIVPIFLFMTKIISSRKVYLVDFSCYIPEPRYLHTKETIHNTITKNMNPETSAFFRKVLDSSGMSDNTYLYAEDGNLMIPKSSFQCNRKETEIVIFAAVDDLLSKTRVDPRDIGIVIVNISTFNPVPSLSAMIVNRYKLREDILSYNLGGMGCSAGLISIDLAKQLLQVRHNTYALIVSLESVTSSYYVGNDRSKLLSLSLFRMGGAAVLLSNKQSDRGRSKYELKHTLRTHKGSDDKAYNCVMQGEDKDGNLGVTLTKDIMTVAGEALKSNITALGPLVLPLSEQLRFLASIVMKKIFKMKDVRPYVPDFKKAFEHFCIHAGGKAVLNAMEKNLKLSEWHMEPSRMTLYKFGNTSSSSLWYELAYTEAKGRIRKGDRIWQIAFGSGFKCNSAVWCALKTIDKDKEKNPWTTVIDHFPIHIST